MLIATKSHLHDVAEIIILAHGVLRLEMAVDQPEHETPRNLAVVLSTLLLDLQVQLLSNSVRANVLQQRGADLVIKGHPLLRRDLEDLEEMDLLSSLPPCVALALAFGLWSPPGFFPLGLDLQWLAGCLSLPQL